MTLGALWMTLGASWMTLGASWMTTSDTLNCGITHDDSKDIIYKHDIFIIQATGVIFLQKIVCK